MTNGEKLKLNTPLHSVIGEEGLFKELLPFDEYHLVMAQTDVLMGMNEMPAVKTYFYRIPPFEGSYIISAGLSSFLNKVDSFNYKNLIPYLEEKGYDKKFIDYVKKRDKLKVKVVALPENTPAFPSEPIIILETILIDARILEGMVLGEMNFASLCATKWHRIRNAALKRPIMEFGRRRAQNSLKASLYAYIAGVNFTSNCEANYLFGIPSSGTMGHEFVQTFLSEEEAFDKWLELNPSRPCLLLDTLSTMESGVVNAVKAFRKHKKNLQNLGFWDKISFRIDSGDLAYLGVSCYEILSKELETNNIEVVLSNDLDEYSLTSIFAQLNSTGHGKIIDHMSFGIGTKGATAWGEPALGGVCKLGELGNNYILKISNNMEKTTIPGNVRSSLIYDKNGQYVTTLIYLAEENIEDIDKFMHLSDDTKCIVKDKNFSPIKSRQVSVYSSDGFKSRFIGEYSSRCILDMRRDGDKDLATLDWSYKRVASPHSVKVSLSPKIFALRKDMSRLRMIAKPKS